MMQLLTISTLHEGAGVSIAFTCGSYTQLCLAVSETIEHHCTLRFMNFSSAVVDDRANTTRMHKRVCFEGRNYTDLSLMV